MPEVQGQEFQNGENAHGVSFVSPDGSFEIDTIDITSTYPPQNELGEVWVKNEGSHMLATLISGGGRIAVRQTIEGLVSHEINELSRQTAVYVPAHSWYAWQADAELTAAATFVPPFQAEHYHEMSELDIQMIETLQKVIKNHLDTLDLVFLDDLRNNPEDALDFVYERLLMEEEDPEAILREYGILRKGEEQ